MMERLLDVFKDHELDTLGRDLIRLQGWIGVVLERRRGMPKAYGLLLRAAFSFSALGVAALFDERDRRRLRPTVVKLPAE